MTAAEPLKIMPLWVIWHWFFLIFTSWGFFKVLHSQSAVTWYFCPVVWNRRLRVTSVTRLRQGSFYITASQPASQPPTSVLCQMLSRALPSAAYTQALPTIHSKQSCCLCNPQSLRKQNEGYLRGQRVWDRALDWPHMGGPFYSLSTADTDCVTWGNREDFGL